MYFKFKCAAKHHCILILGAPIGIKWYWFWIVWWVVSKSANQKSRSDKHKRHFLFNTCSSERRDTVFSAVFHIVLISNSRTVVTYLMTGVTQGSDPLMFYWTASVILVAFCYHPQKNSSPVLSLCVCVCVLWSELEQTQKTSKLKGI